MSIAGNGRGESISGGKLLTHASTNEMPCWYEERLIQPICYPQPRVPLQVRLRRFLRSLTRPVTSEAFAFVDLEVKEYIDEMGNMAAHRFIGFSAREEADRKAWEAQK